MISLRLLITTGSFFNMAAFSIPRQVSGRYLNKLLYLPPTTDAGSHSVYFLHNLRLSQEQVRLPVAMLMIENGRCKVNNNNNDKLMDE